MKKIILISLLLALTTAFVNAQNYELGVRVGLNLSNNLGDIDMNIKPGVNLGLVADIYMNDNLYIQPGLFYSLKGSKNDISFTSSGSSVRADVKYNLHYLEVPVSVGYKLSLGSASIMLQTGPYFAVGMTGKVKVDASASMGGNELGISGNGKVFGGDGLKRGDLGWNIGGGIRFSRIYAGLQYGIGILNLGDSDYKIRNGNFSINLGYYF